jgi:hypothetical protein
MAVQSKIVGGLLKIVTKYGKYYTGDNAVKITDNYIIIKVNNENEVQNETTIDRQNGGIL